MKSECLNVFDCLKEDHESLKGVLAQLLSSEVEVGRKRAIFKRFLPLFSSHTFAEEQTVFQHGLLEDNLRPMARQGLEEHELSEILLERIRLAVDDEQWLARVKVFCGSLEHHLQEEEKETFPAMEVAFSAEQKNELGRRYLDIRNRHQLGPVIQLPIKAQNRILAGQAGKIGYVIAWLLGVPFWLLLLVFLVRG